MAKFCGNCGSPMEESQAFCGNCGAQAGAPAGAPQAAAAPPPPASATPAPVAAAPKKGSSPLLKIILIVVGIFAFVTVAGIGACVYIGYRARQTLNETIKVDEAGKGITLKTPKGDIRLGERASGDVKSIGGVPPYPGATPVDKGAQFSVGDKDLISGQEYVTSDSVEDVVNFYKEKLGPKTSVSEYEGQFQLTHADKEDKGITVIHVGRDEETGETKILISHMGE
ncbi:MAG TPA: zinc ribbon domain-containing protein [Terriglobia bacterium]|nr:zinc ribbon domain-containing protein [Terriglobia bacterium]